MVLDLVGSDYSAGSSSWRSRAGSFSATVPASVSFGGPQQAFQFAEDGETITVGIATNPTVVRDVTYEMWVKAESLPNSAWVVTQSPDYGWSRAVTLNDDRLGGVSTTVGDSWTSGLAGMGQVPIGVWMHFVGTWEQDGESTVFLDGVQGNVYEGTVNVVQRGSEERD